MGRNMVELTVTANLSSHNSEQDERDEQAWNLFRAEVQKLAEREEFRDISLMVS